MTEITNDEFARILLRISKKIVSIKGLDANVPENISRDLNAKYKDCQKIVEFLKQIGFKQDLNLNNILFPSSRDMSRILEYTVEYLTNIDTAIGMIDYGGNFNEKNFAKMKLAKQLSAWCKEEWVHPEFIEKVNEKPQILLKASKLPKINYEVHPKGKESLI